MVRFCSLSSGSTGNCVFIEHNGVRVLVDIGFSCKRTEELLNLIKIDPHSIQAIFLTHEHMDHIKGAGVFSRKYNIPIYATKGTWLQFAKISGDLRDENIQIISQNGFFKFKSMDINAFKIYHDANEPCGFTLYLDDKKLTTLTDTGIVDTNMINEIKGSDIYYIESNHDVDYLKRGPYPITRKKRILSKFGHLSNVDCAETLSNVLRAAGEYIFLSHLSNTNNTIQLSYNTVSDILRGYGIDTKKDINLHISPALTPSSMVVLK